MALSDETREQMADLLEDLLVKDPKETKRLIKKNRPEMSIPEIELEDLHAQTQKESEERYGKLESTIGELGKKMDVILTRQDLEKKGRSLEEIKAIEEKIKSKEAPTYAVAEKLYDYDKLTAPRAPETQRVSRGPVGLTEEKLKALKEDPVAFARNEAHEAVSDIHSGKVKLTPGGFAG